MKSFELAAFAEPINERNEVNEESIKLDVEKWRQWLNSHDVPMEKKFSSINQRLYAYQLARAAQIPLPDDLIFTDRHLLKNWIKDKLKKYNKRHQVDSFISEMEAPLPDQTIIK
ncbi:MAG: hypothetical protein Q7V63_07435 [Gammaproteobacteria bacterium]|nr:hypothetical protein [Gammaproteobacteria bacterium]